MKKILKLTTALLLILSFVFAMPGAVFATDEYDEQMLKMPFLLGNMVFDNFPDESFIKGQYECIKKMSEEALEIYMQERCAFVEALKASKKEMQERCIKDFTKIKLIDSYIKINLKLAWLAAAQLAKCIGFSCTGILIERSVFGLPYVEKDGLFALKMRLSGALNVGDGGHNFGLSSPDLYFAIHSCRVNKVEGLSWLYKVTDTFNFDPRNPGYYGNALADFANRIGVLLENTGVLLPIPVIVYITNPRIDSSN